MFLRKKLDKGKYTAVQCKQVEMPETIRDQNQRYYSSNKYFTVGVRDKKAPRIAISKSFDKFMPTHVSKLNRKKLRKGNSISYTYMKHLAHHKGMVNTSLEDNPEVNVSRLQEEDIECLKSPFMHQGFRVKLSNIPSKNKNDNAVKYKLSKSLLRKVVPKVKLRGKRKAQGIKISMKITKDIECVTGKKLERYK